MKQIWKTLSIVASVVLIPGPSLVWSADGLVGESAPLSGGSAPGSAPASAMTPLGVWHQSEGATKIEIFQCGSVHCGKIVYLRNPIDPKTGKPRTDTLNPDPAKRNQPLLGSLVLYDMKPDAPNRWNGNVYRADNGKTYTGTLTVTSADSITLRGCILGGLVCKSGTLIRVP